VQPNVTSQFKNEIINSKTPVPAVNSRCTHHHTDISLSCLQDAAVNRQHTILCKLGGAKLRLNMQCINAVQFLITSWDAMFTLHHVEWRTKLLHVITLHTKHALNTIHQINHTKQHTDRWGGNATAQNNTRVHTLRWHSAKNASAKTLLVKLSPYWLLLPLLAAFYLHVLSGRQYCP